MDVIHAFVITINLLISKARLIHLFSEQTVSVGRIMDVVQWAVANFVCLIK